MNSVAVVQPRFPNVDDQSYHCSLCVDGKRSSTPGPSMQSITHPSELEAAIAALTMPINGQYPRPWMTDLKNPLWAKVFTVGANQRNGYDVRAVGTHDHYLDTLFNRGAENCRQLYDRVVGSPSPTRKNTDALVSRLRKHGVKDVLETNVVCYSTPMSSDLGRPGHAGGKERGSEIFAVLVKLLKPRVMISHGAGTARALGRFLGLQLPEPPNQLSDPVVRHIGNTAVVIVPSLAPPQFNKWSNWSDPYLEAVCQKVGTILRQG